MKSHIIQLFLVLLFGPLGLLYSTPGGFLLGLLVLLALFFALGFLALPISFILNIILGIAGVSNYNKRR